MVFKYSQEDEDLHCNGLCNFHTILLRYINAIKLKIITYFYVTPGQRQVDRLVCNRTVLLY
jgi:hypothetical protein